MANLSALVGGGVKSIQTGWLGGVAALDGAGGTEYDSYYEVTLSPEVVVANCIAWFDGALGASELGGAAIASSVNQSYRVTSVVTATDTLKLGCTTVHTSNEFYGRWYVVEFY